MSNVSNNNQNDELNEPIKKGKVTEGLPSWMQGGGAIIFGFKRPADFVVQSSKQELQQTSALKPTVYNTNLTPRDTDQDDK